MREPAIRAIVALRNERAPHVRVADTTGMANPAQVRRLFNRVRSVIGDRTGAAHMHNTRGLGLANCLAEGAVHA